MAKVRSIDMTHQEVSDVMFGDDYGKGYCIACGADRYECEPDAENYECHECGAMKVFGVENLMIMGVINVTS